MGKQRESRLAAGSQNNDRHELFKRHEWVCKLMPNDSCALVPKKYYKAVEANNIELLKQEINFCGKINENNYFPALEMLLGVEEAHQEVEMRKHDLLAYRIICTLTRGRRFYEIKLSGQASNKFVDISDLVLIEEPKSSANFITRILDIRGDCIQLKMGNKPGELSPFLFVKKLFDREVNVYFISANIWHKAFKRALEFCHTTPWMHAIIFEKFDHRPDNASNEKGRAFRGYEPRRKIDIFDKRFANEYANTRLNTVLNHEQRVAVESILRGECRPKPNILFGPPGTGKTHTVVEAIIQIYLRSQFNVLICANSNTCVDHIFKKLERSRLFAQDDLTRFRASRFNASFKNRIVVTTNIKAYHFIGQATRFDYVFIDEAGHAHEAESLIPICTLNEDGVVTLAGDPKQLGPVVHFQPAAGNGLGRAMLERIIRWQIYKKHDGKYDQRFITKLLECYRCDPRILAISNRSFYCNELRHSPKGARTPNSILRILDMESPVQIRFSNGPEFQPSFSTSWMNPMEADSCVELYVQLLMMGLMPGQIGIMSPYRFQTRSIRRRLEERLESKETREVLQGLFTLKEEKIELVTLKQVASCKKNISSYVTRVVPKAKGLVELIYRTDREYDPQDWMCKVDTIDAFQGSEREIIIFSPVRTNQENLSFLSDKKRFNVAMSRAKWLLIAVGHKNVLKLDNLDLSHSRKYWIEFLKRAEELKMRKISYKARS